ncbi:hypothetical protein IID21_00040 [Patescibacteria group bacterium]|nr:hypothetical protein [Patescibacteria group bacterium]
MIAETFIYKNRFAFIPHNLNIEDRPELNDFPFNVLFVSYRKVKGVDISGTALYEPEIESYRGEEERYSLDYRNIYGRENLLIITKDEDKWEGIKIINDERVLIATGRNWKQFFIHLTMPGLSNREKCKLERLFPTNGKIH